MIDVTILNANGIGTPYSSIIFSDSFLKVLNIVGLFSVTVGTLLSVISFLLISVGNENSIGDVFVKPMIGGLLIGI